MTVFVFLGSLLGAIGIGVPISFALMVAGVALMLQFGNLDAQILAQKLIDGADSDEASDLHFQHANNPDLIRQRPECPQAKPMHCP